MEFLFYVLKNEPYTFDLTLLGYDAGESVPVYDIWAKQQVGVATATLSADVPTHGARLFRLGNNVADGIQAPTAHPQAPEAKGRTSSPLYDLQGRLVQQPGRGFYVKDGKTIYHN